MLRGEVLAGEIPDNDIYSLGKLINETRRLAVEYRRATGKPLAVSQEIARYDAALHLGLRLVEEAEVGIDAIGEGEREGRRILIKGRAIFDPGKSGARIGQLKLERDWDWLVLVLMDEELQPTEIFEVDRNAVLDALDQTKNSNRAKRGALSVAAIRHIGELAWSRERGLEEPVWTNHD